MTFDEARAQFPVLEKHAYLNAGTNGPLAQATVDALVTTAERDLRDGRSGRALFEEMLALRKDVRRGLAAVIEVDPALMAIVDSTTRGCSTVIAGLDLAPEDEIVITDQEHFGLMGPVHASGTRVVVTAADEDAILAAVTPRTKLIATSHVLWTTGQRLDIARLKDESGVPILVDGAQSAGAIRAEAEPFDFYTVSAQKWLCGPELTGGLYVRDPDRLRVASPSYASQTAYEPDGSFTPKDGAERFDSSFIGVPTLKALVTALGTHPEWRYERAGEMADRCGESLAEHVEVLTPPGHSTLVTFRPSGDPTELVASLEQRGVIVRELPRRNMVRASCGWWTNEDDLARLIEGLAG